MSKPTLLSIGMGVTLQPASYESIRADVRLEIQLDDGDDLDEEAEILREMVANKISDTVKRVQVLYEAGEWGATKSDKKEEDLW